MQEIDSTRRLAILRGEIPPPLPESEPEIDPSDKKFARRDRDNAIGFISRKRKRADEDDTDFEMRMAQERAALGQEIAKELRAPGPDGLKSEEVDIVGKDGHINLVGAPLPTDRSGKNPEYEREAAKKKREMEDQYTMRFSNAAGRDGFAAGDPWYAKSGSRSSRCIPTKEELDAEVGIEAPTKDVWGKEDPRRKAREAERITINDPLAMMKMGAKRVREVTKERRREDKERERELRDLRKEERRQEKRQRREQRDDSRERRRDRDGHSSDRTHRSEPRHRDREREERRDRHRNGDRDRDKSRGSEQSNQRPQRDGEEPYRQHHHHKHHHERVKER